MTLALLIAAVLQQTPVAPPPTVPPAAPGPIAGTPSATLRTLIAGSEHPLLPPLAEPVPPADSAPVDLAPVAPATTDLTMPICRPPSGGMASSVGNEPGTSSGGGGGGCGGIGSVSQPIVKGV